MDPTTPQVQIFEFWVLWALTSPDLPNHHLTLTWPSHLQNTLGNIKNVNVLITGGFRAVKSAEIYHPDLDSPCVLPDLPWSRRRHTQDGQWHWSWGHWSWGHFCVQAFGHPSHAGNGILTPGPGTWWHSQSKERITHPGHQQRTRWLTSWGDMWIILVLLLKSYTMKTVKLVHHFLWNIIQGKDWGITCNIDQLIIFTLQVCMLNTRPWYRHSGGDWRYAHPHNCVPLWKAGVDRRLKTQDLKQDDIITVAPVSG